MLNSQLVLIISVISVISVMKLFTQRDQLGGGLIEINDVIFNGDRKRLEQISRRPINLFKLPLALDHIKPPAINDSATTKKELNYLAKIGGLSAKAKQREDAVRFSRKGEVLKYFSQFAGSQGLAYDPKYLSEVARDVKTMCMKLKLVYNRPRPHQLAFVHKIVLDTSSMGTIPLSPSYPSCATTQAYVLAKLLSHNNPNAKRQLMGMAKQVELSRLYATRNYPTDNSCALKLAKVIISKIKKLNIK